MPATLAFEPTGPVKLFSDLNTKTPGVSSEVINLEAIVRRIMNAINQPPMQRLWDPSGLDKESFLFRISDAGIETQVRNYLDKITRDDPTYKVDRQNTQIIALDKDNHLLLMQIAFTIPQQNDAIYTFAGNIRIG